MPVVSCTSNGKAGFKFGTKGKCFTGSGGRSKAARQGRAIKASQSRSDELEDALPMINLRRANRNIVKARLRKIPRRMLFPFAVEMQYRLLLQNYIRQLEEQVDKVYTKTTIELLVQSRNSTIPESARTDAWPDDIERLNTTLELNFDDVRVNTAFIAGTIANGVNTWNDREWRKAMRSVLGVDIFQREPFLNDTINSFVKENVALIKSIPEKYLNDVASSVQRGVRAGETSKTIALDIEKRTKVTRNRAKFIARDQVSKLNGQLARLRQTNVGVDDYTWRTALDERVRATHKANEGRKFKWNKPPAVTGHPGEDFQCRCIAEPNFDKLLAAIQ